MSMAELSNVHGRAWEDVYVSLRLPRAEHGWLTAHSTEGLAGAHRRASEGYGVSPHGGERAVEKEAKDQAIDRNGQASF